VDLAALCASTGTSYARVETAAELTRALAHRSLPRGIRVLEVRTDRGSVRDLHHRLAEAVAAAV
jgi:2-succinyl-5-enolpyruvyl-6-hydroxy-3-cyclohexene-1-carboxylate synthase